VIERIYRGVVTAFENPELLARMKATGQKPVANAPAEFTARVLSD
jgi:tripartite-type tricarboxylate transporter receptor subunit TctC